jgi:hypothetical protein
MKAAAARHSGVNTRRAAMKKAMPCGIAFFA